jgi:hypothetical protein
MLRTLLLAGLFATATAGCYAEEPDVAYAGGGAYGPDLEEVSPGVQVIADTDYPEFYSDGFYWQYNGGIWYRSGYWNGGWGLAYNVPYGVRGIRNPGGYAHWRGGGGGVGVRGYGGGYATVRDHRSYGGAGYARGGGYRAAPARSGGGGFRGGSRGGGGGHGGGGHGGGGHR